MFKRCILPILSMIVAASIFVIVFHCAGYDVRIVHRYEDIGIPSDDGAYYLVETSDSTGRYLMYTVVQLDVQDSEDYTYYPKTVFVTDDFWYLSRFIKDYGWIDGTYDFYIDSSDVGSLIYTYDGETWAGLH